MATRTIHPFPAKMAPDIAIERLENLPAASAKIVLDPMCGSGTVLTAASLRGHTSRGFDMDPLAVLMSTVATKPVDTQAVHEQAEEVCRAARASTLDEVLWTDLETKAFAEYWFGKEQRTQLNRLSREINAVEDETVRQVLQVALSRIIVTKSPRASLAADTSHSRPHKVIASSDYDVYKGFTGSTQGLSKLLDARGKMAHVRVAEGDARSLDLDDNFVDLVVTSPPYLNAIDYLRGHKMSLIWFGYSILQLRRIRSQSIGAERRLGTMVREEVVEMVETIKGLCAEPEKLPLGTITRYAHDLLAFAHELHRVCKTQAEVVTVIGNSTLRGNYIQNDLLVQRAYDMAGFSSVSRIERDLPQNRRYLPITATDATSSMTKRMRAEVILTVKKP